MSDNDRSYAWYIGSPHWTATKDRYRHSGRPWRCYVCGGDGALALHHRTYERMGAEELDDLVPVHAGCHARIHRLHRASKGRLSLDQATERARLPGAVRRANGEDAAPRRGTPTPERDRRGLTNAQRRRLPPTPIPDSEAFDLDAELAAAIPGSARWRSLVVAKAAAERDRAPT